MKARKLLLTSVSSAVLGLSLMSISAPLSDNSNLIYGENIISNGDFEINGGEYTLPRNAPTGDTVISGIGALGVDIQPVATSLDNNTVLRFKGVGFSSFFKLLTIEAGATYTFSFDYKLEGTTDNIGFAFWNSTDSNRLPEVNIMDANQNQDCSFEDLENGFRRVTITRSFEAGKVFDSIHFWVNCGDGSSTIYADNFSLVKEGTTDNIFKGGDFEGFLDFATSEVPSDPGEDGIYGTNARIENHSVILANAGTYGQVVDGLTEDNYQIDISLVSSEIPADSTLKLEFLAEDNSVLTSYDIFTNGTASTNLVEGDYTYNIEGVDDVTKVQLNYTGETEVAVDLFSIRPTYENVFDSEKEYYESGTLTVNGDFEAFEVGTKLSENQLEGAWGSVSLDTPGTIVETDHDGKAVQIGRTDASDTHQYSSFFLMVPPELQIGDLIRFQYEYKLEIQGEPMSYIEINSTFVGGANRSYYLEDLRQLNYDEDYKQTSGVEDIPFPIKYEVLEDGWIRTTLDFQVTNNKIQWDSVRWIITPQSVGDTLTVDNVSIKYLSETPFVSEVSTVKINEGDIELNAGEVKKLTTTITPADAEDKTITWKSSDTSVATVSSDGTVTAIKEGVCEITATSSNGKSDSIVVTVLGNGGTTSPEDNSNQGLIIGLSVAGAIVALGLIGGLTYYFIRKKKSKSSK